ncbi:hypothetical protein GFY24_20120 [Nocardia sp. SYP-A9097]|uniref:type II toxin-antitoxin system Phd/YefM family antitoxin n=1 Tax=Nocardia sp. SYP-A9097 TaxID=2663237 RepID=UPI00129B2E74|nr:type II toxin-antitoxin system Phd/YefM family antitoxin [Nocardia sp. SYP-A9097]MRH89722.1 hypothetical protein [Nocardia sp. SYP-A9097]
MKSIDTAALRVTWRDAIAKVCSGAEEFVILQRGRPEAVLLSESNWLLGCTKIPVPEANQLLRAASDARSSLRAVRTAAHLRGQHTLIRKLYGTLYRDGSGAQLVAVIAPYDWVRMSLPEL